MFNPPYVPTSSEETFLPYCFQLEVKCRSIESAYAGGERGREVIDALLPDIHVRALLNDGKQVEYFAKRWYFLFVIGACKCSRRSYGDFGSNRSKRISTNIDLNLIGS